MQRPYYHNSEVIHSISKTMKNREKKVKSFNMQQSIQYFLN